LWFSRDGKLVESGGGEFIIRLWDAVTGEPKGTRKGSTLADCGTAISDDGRFQACLLDHRVCLYGPPAGSERVKLQHTARVGSLAFSPGSKVLACGNADGTVWLWSLPSLLRSKK
jgi:WD40 repeat protein